MSLHCARGLTRSSLYREEEGDLSPTPYTMGSDGESNVASPPPLTTATRFAPDGQSTPKGVITARDDLVTSPTNYYSRSGSRCDLSTHPALPDYRIRPASGLLHYGGSDDSSPPAGRREHSRQRREDSCMGQGDESCLYPCSSDIYRSRDEQLLLSSSSDKDDSAYHEPLYYNCGSSPSGHEEAGMSGFYRVQEERLHEVEGRVAVLESRVSCIHREAGCGWAGQLGRLQAHLSACQKDAVYCTNNCGAKVARVSMEDHMTFTCSNREVDCIFCRGRFKGGDIEEHQSVCGFEPIACINHCGLKVTRNRIQAHLNTVCTKRQVECRYCSFLATADQLQSHHLKCPRFPVPCPNRCGGEFSREKIGLHVDQCSQELSICPYRSAGCAWRGASVEVHMAEAAPHHLELLARQCRAQAALISTLRNQLEEARISRDGVLVWRIVDFWSKMAEARSKEGLELVSMPFLTGPAGYRLQVSLFPNGNGGGEGSHMSVYIKILPGDSDAVLKWPFRHTVSFTLLDQNPDRRGAVNVVESFIPDPNWPNFQRPSKRSDPDQLGFGFPKFVAHSVLQLRNYVKDNTLYLKIRTDPSQSVRV